MRFAAWIAIATAGCSTVAVRGPSGDALHAGSPPQCTHSEVAPALDTIGAVAFAITSVALLKIASRPVDPELDLNDFGRPLAGLGGLLSLGPTLFYGVSAVSGYSKVSRCDEVTGLYAVTHWAGPNASVSPRRLALPDALRFCRSQNLTLPSRSQAAALSSERFPVTVWTSTLATGDELESGGPRRIVSDGSAQAFALNLSSSSFEGTRIDRELYAVCVPKP